MKQLPKRPLLNLVEQNDRRPVEVLELVSDILRNIPNIARIGGPEEMMVAPVGGRAMDSATIEFLNYLSKHYLSTYEQRQALKPGEWPQRLPGERFNVPEWLFSVAILLKSAQVQLAARGKEHLALVDRYLALPGPFQDRRGVNADTLKKWKQKNGNWLRSEVFTVESVGLGLSLMLPDDFESWGPACQKALLYSLKTGLDSVMAPYFDSRFPAEIFTFPIDFSEHSDAQILKTVRSLKPHLATPRPQRIERLFEIFSDALWGVQDLIGDISLWVRLTRTEAE